MTIIYIILVIRFNNKVPYKFKKDITIKDKYQRFDDDDIYIYHKYVIKFKPRRKKIYQS